MKRSWQRVLAIVLAVMLMTSLGTALAANDPVVVASTHKLTVDGKAVGAAAFNIDGSNYFRLRDVAFALSGTKAQFSLNYDSAADAIVIETGKAYAAQGGELAAVESPKSVSVSAQKVTVNGKAVSLSAYNIDGSNFFKLRDLGAALGFGVGFDSATLTAQISSEGAGLDQDAMYQYILAEFVEIAKTPRGSGNTDAISDYLYKWGTDHGFESMQDEVGNVRWDIPATAGFESQPLTVLQTHMDMVVVSDDGRDMTKSPVTVVENAAAGTITSDGHTSLGSDDGIGIASAMYLATSSAYSHGPLRVIVTINEEGGSPSGVGNMDHDWVMDAKYMVNIDSEDYATCTVAACGFMAYMYNVPLTSESVGSGKVAYTIDLSGLKGGHSGVDIEKNRANAIKAVDYCLAWAKYNGIDVQIASFTGGTGMTAIPTLSSATIVFSSQYASEFETEMAQTIELFANQFDRTESGYSFTFAKAALPTTVLTAECSATVIDLIASLEDGVNTISQRYEGITETSFNLGTVNVTAGSESTRITMAMRCSTRWPVMISNMQFVAIGNAFGLEVTSWSPDPFDPDNINVGWEEKESDTIALIYAKAFKEFTGDDCLITGVHGGLECADFAEWNPNMEIISVGPTIENPHSCSESIEIDTIATTCGAVATLLTYLATGVTAK